MNKIGRIVRKKSFSFPLNVAFPRERREGTIYTHRREGNQEWLLANFWTLYFLCLSSVQFIYYSCKRITRGGIKFYDFDTTKQMVMWKVTATANEEYGESDAVVNGADDVVVPHVDGDEGKTLLRRGSDEGRLV